MQGRRGSHLAVAVLAALLASPAGTAAAEEVEELGWGGARPSCRFVGLAGDLDVDGGGTDWYGGLNLPDPVRANEWQPVAEGPLAASGDTLTGTWELYKEPFGTAQVDLRVGDEVSREAQDAEEGTFQVTYYAMTGTVTVQDVTYPITGCRLVGYRGPEALPRTGPQTGALAGAGALLLAAGAGMVAVARRLGTPPPDTP